MKSSNDLKEAGLSKANNKRIGKPQVRRFHSLLPLNDVIHLVEKHLSGGLTIESGVTMKSKWDSYGETTSKQNEGKAKNEKRSNIMMDYLLQDSF